MAQRPPTPVPPSPAAPAPPRRRSRMGLFLFLFLILLIGGFALYVWSTLRLTYSDGERAGYVQKFSHKGWLCKTWEGDLAMANQPGMIQQQTFQFSVRDPAVADQINHSMGQRVALHYEQHKGVPTSCFGETEYYVTRVDPVKAP
ncbi:MAG: hypothetical protein QOJ16_87 [Acidobacteriota bacterium]|nr:hypothetical protein [Acidobacteriota bacterium]